VVHPKYKTLLGSADPGQAISPTDPPFIPIPCYSGITPGDGVTSFTLDQIEGFERLIIAATRRRQLLDAPKTQLLSAHAAAGGKPPPGTEHNVTTPSGIVATLQSQGNSATWKEILLGQTVTPAATKMSFMTPSDDLREAFQTSDLFFVVANADHFGGPFANSLNIANWDIEADVGNSAAYGDYANVMIVKGMKGPLFDPNGDAKHNLVANPSKWTQAGTFAAPTVDGKSPDQAQLVILSQWLQDYFAGALAETDHAFFQPFADIATDPDWTGILVLRAKIAKPPEDIAGILAGVKDPDAFYAHHLGIEISQIKIDANTGDVKIDGDSSIFGLIYYVDPDYDPAKPQEPVAPDPGDVYDFRVLTLKVLFQNTAVKKFTSYAQLTLNTLFGSAVTGMGPGGNPYNSIILTGSYQDNNGSPVYGLGAVGDSTFLFDSNILNKIEITAARLATISADANNVVSAFGMTGFLDFKLLSTGGKTPEDIDLLSFGSSTGQIEPRKGLAFSHLNLDMAFATTDPLARTLVFDESKIAFNLQASTPRPGSLFKALGLELESLIEGTTADDAPAKQGYLNVVTDVRLGGVGEAWQGLRFRLNLGTPGELAGKVGLNAHLLLAWSPDSQGTQYKATAGVQMPGASNGGRLISLQTVLSLSYGTIQLLYSPKPSGKGKQFMFVLNEIAIKFLSLKKLPPSGVTAFYLFGDAGDGGGGAVQQSGLGWYAAYNNEPKAGPKALDGPDDPPLLPDRDGA